MDPIRTYWHTMNPKPTAARRAFAIAMPMSVAVAAVAVAQSSISRSVTVVNHAPTPPTVSEATSRSVTVVNHAPAEVTLAEAISRSLTACNRAGFVDTDADGVHDCDDRCPGCDDADDFDGDGAPDGCGGAVCDNCPDHANPDQHDCDFDGIGDVCAIATWISTDCNTNRVPDECEPSSDCDENGQPDFCQTDCNGDGVADACELADGSGEDCTGNGVLDVCEADCNANGTADSCDIAAGRSTDCGPNGVPDECEPDCDGNGLTDSCEILRGLADDCDANGVPDACERDCNRNARADSCDLVDGTSEDCNGDGVPDECTPAAADIDRSGFIDLADFAEVQNCMGVELGARPECAPADATSDSLVGIEDFAVLVPAWGAAPLLPDVALTDVEAPTRAAQGDTTDFRFTLSNAGCADADGIASLTLDLRRPGESGVLHRLAAREVAFTALTPGSTAPITQSATVPADVDPGTYEVLGCLETSAPYCAAACDSLQNNNCQVHPLLIVDDTPSIWISNIDVEGVLVSGRTARVYSSSQ